MRNSNPTRRRDVFSNANTREAVRQSYERGLKRDMAAGLKYFWSRPHRAAVQREHIPFGYPQFP